MATRGAAEGGAILGWRESSPVSRRAGARRGGGLGARSHCRLHASPPPSSDTPSCRTPRTGCTLTPPTVRSPRRPCLTASPSTSKTTSMRPPSWRPTTVRPTLGVVASPRPRRGLCGRETEGGPPPAGEAGGGKRGGRRGARCPVLSLEGAPSLGAPGSPLSVRSEHRSRPDHRLTCLGKHPFAHSRHSGHQEGRDGRGGLRVVQPHLG